MDNDFFEEMREQSQIKATIVLEYFWLWAKIILAANKSNPNRKIAYIDLFAGAGRYKAGSPSTPLLVLTKAIEDPEIREHLVTVFNDYDEKNRESLEREIANIPNLDLLRYKPQVYGVEVGEEIVKILEQTKLVPSLFFVDPCGYKGLSLGLLKSALKDWGSDGIIFFNYNRINPGLDNKSVANLMNAIFGSARTDSLRKRIENMTPEERETAIVNEFIVAVQELGCRYVLPFCFKNDKGVRTSHYLVFASKHFKGYEKMKEIMYKYSSTRDQGVPSLVYVPVDRRYPTLFELTRPLDDLKGMLLADYAGRTLEMREIYEQHSVGKPFLERHYKDVLIKLEAEGKVSADPLAAMRPKQRGDKTTFGPHVRVTFPSKKM